MQHEKINQELKRMFSIALHRLIEEAKGNPELDTAQIGRVITAEGLLFAAEMHEGSDASFVNMARRALALVRTGAIEQ